MSDPAISSLRESWLSPPDDVPIYCRCGHDLFLEHLEDIDADDNATIICVKSFCDCRDGKDAN